VRNTNVVVCDDVCSLSGKATLKIKRDSCVEITFTFFNLSSLGFLICVDKPLEIVFFKLTNIRVVLFFSNFDALIPSVELLIHAHSFLNFIILEKYCFCTMELLI